MISEYIYPLLKLMHSFHPLERDLSIVIEDHGTIQFVPKLNLYNCDYRDHYIRKAATTTSEFLLASLRVGSEFDIDVKQDPDNTDNYIFTMTLDE